MTVYLEAFIRSFKQAWDGIVYEVTHPGISSTFYILIGLSLVFWALELTIPWRKKQATFRKDFWLDGFYMFFNLFLFGLIGFLGYQNIVKHAFSDLLGLFGLTNPVAISLTMLPQIAQLAILFVIDDFLAWNIHRLLHRVPFLWRFHQVHHSVKQMGFAAHLRYHWMENIVYWTIKYIPLAMIGFDIQQYFIITIVTLGIGHFNHSNINIPLGPLKYLFNNPQMHIWHHAKNLPKERPYGVNFGISLSIWDYLFRTNYIPHSGRDITLGFDGDEQFPEGFGGQNVYPFTPKPDQPQ